MAAGKRTLERIDKALVDMHGRISWLPTGLTVQRFSHRGAKREEEFGVHGVSIDPCRVWVMDVAPRLD